MVIGVRVDSENIQTGLKKHCNSSYFTMVAKDTSGEKVNVPKLIIKNLEEVRRFYDALRKINQHKKTKNLEEKFDHTSQEALEKIKEFNVLLDF